MDAVEEVRQLEGRLLQGDLDPSPDTSAVFDELLADDVLFVQPQGQTIGKAGVLNGHRPPRKRNFVKVENSEMEIRECGSAVAVACRTDYTIQDRTFAFRSLRLWKRVGSTWKVVVVALMDVPKEDA